MPVSEAQKRASLKYQAEHLATLGCKVKKSEALAFKNYATNLGKASNTVLKEFVLDCINETISRDSNSQPEPQAVSNPQSESGSTPTPTPTQAETGGKFTKTQPNGEAAGPPPQHKTPGPDSTCPNNDDELRPMYVYHTHPEIGFINTRDITPDFLRSHLKDEDKHWIADALISGIIPIISIPIDEIEDGEMLEEYIQEAVEAYQETNRDDVVFYWTGYAYDSERFFCEIKYEHFQNFLEELGFEDETEFMLSLSEERRAALDYSKRNPPEPEA